MTIVKRGICRSFNESHGLEAGSAIEKIQNCHIGNYMEGYLTHGNYFYVSTATVNPRCCFFALNYECPYPPLNFIKNLYKG
jgi:hypothetical protein